MGRTAETHSSEGLRQLCARVVRSGVRRQGVAVAEGVELQIRLYELAKSARIPRLPRRSLRRTKHRHHTLLRARLQTRGTSEASEAVTKLSSYHELVAIELQDLINLGALHDDALHAARVADEQREPIAYKAEANVHFLVPQSSAADSSRLLAVS